MENTDLIALLNRLCQEPNESEWIEFKSNRYNSQEIGEYLSALSNSACLLGKPFGYLVFGVDDQLHDIVGTIFDPYSDKEKGKGNQSLLLWLATNLQPNIGFTPFVFTTKNKRVVLFEIHSAYNQPVRFKGIAYIRIGTSKTELRNHPDKERVIWSRCIDWSAQICENATLDDLDPTAIRKARSEYKVKFPNRANEVDSWDDTTLLNKTSLTIKGAITNSAMLLVGKSESAALISPAVARISWILKDDKSNEKDYEHFDPPFLVNVDKVLLKIRNLTIRELPGGTLFPKEIHQYDEWVLREALHNCIAHQDYLLRGRIILVEMPTRLFLSNVGSFLPGSVERVIQQDAPQEIYRNSLLVKAMVNLNMIDTQGGGIKRMFLTQKERFFPMPDYDLSDSSRVLVTIHGMIVNEYYTRLLMTRTNLDLWAVMSLDKVQKGLRIGYDIYKKLKKMGLVEGRYPNIYVSTKVAKATGLIAEYIRKRGFERKYYRDIVIDLIQHHGPVSREEIDQLLMNKLPEVLNDDKKSILIHNLLTSLRKKGLIKNRGSRKSPKWVKT